MVVKLYESDGVKVFNVTADKVLPQWVQKKRGRKLSRDEGYARHIELLQVRLSPPPMMPVRVAECYICLLAACHVPAAKHSRCSRTQHDEELLQQPEPDIPFPPSSLTLHHILYHGASLGRDLASLAARASGHFSASFTHTCLHYMDSYTEKHYTAVLAEE